MNEKCRSTPHARYPRGNVTRSHFEFSSPKARKNLDCIEFYEYSIGLVSVPSLFKAQITFTTHRTVYKTEFVCNEWVRLEVFRYAANFGTSLFLVKTLRKNGDCPNDVAVYFHFEINKN